MILFLLIGLIISSGAILFASNFFSRYLISKYIYSYLEVSPQEISSSVELMVVEIRMLSLKIMENQNIYNIVDEQGLSTQEKDKQLKNLFDELSIQKEIVGNITIITNKNEMYNCISNAPGIPKPDENFIYLIKKSSMPVWGTIVKDDHNSAYIPVGVKFRSFNTGEYLGYLMIYIKESSLYETYSKIISGWGYSFIISDDKYVISHPDKNSVGNTIFDSDIFYSDKTFDFKTVKLGGKNVILTIYQFGEHLKSLGVNWKIVTVIPEKELFNVISEINKYVFIISVLMVTIALLAAVYISLNITRKVAKLKKKVKAFGKNDTIVALNVRTGDEIWELDKSFNDMMVRISDLLRKNIEEKEKQRELELIALQAQINPHFLYNTLDAIGWIAKVKRQNDIEQLVMALAKFFRLSLHKGEKFITVEEEIQLVQSYVKIEQMRSPGKFEIFYNIPEDIKDYKMLKIILQPLVENSIKHGVDQKKGNGRITINGYLINDELKFEVIDNGKGFDINSRNYQKALSNKLHSGYGLNNVDERIKLEYGEKYGLNIHSEIGKGTMIAVLLRIKL